ncbi:MAG: LacI family DNA-binding transcriptional regulator [Anaerolineales bacterium]|nr:LacI family DNA-binding transcriptional regulator [Anaerolineales bacterium]
MARKATAADIARKAGVSIMTVSRVVNHKGDVSPATRRRVEQIITRLNYRPSGIARSLVTRQSGTIGLVIPDVSNPFFADVALGAEHVACAEGYNVYLCHTAEDPERELSVIASLEEKRVDGLVLFSRLEPKSLSAAVDHQTAVVLINRLAPRNTKKTSVGSVRLDDVLGGRLVTHHLLESGRRAIGFLSGPAASHSARNRVIGYREALASAGMPRDPAWEHPCPPTVDGGQAAARALLLAKPELTALFCFNDLVAVGALQACAELGRKVPRDLAVAGYDDIPLAALVTPPLTTCRTPRYELGAEAVRQLLGRIRGEKSAAPETILQPQLVVRASAP